MRNSHACDLCTIYNNDSDFSRLTATGVFLIDPSPFLSPNHFLLGPKSAKGKPSANPPRPTTTEASDNSLSDFYASDDNRGKSESKDSNSEDNDAQSEDDDFGATGMTEGEARQMFNDEVMCFIFNIHHIWCADSTVRCPRMQPLFLTRTTMSLK